MCSVDKTEEQQGKVLNMTVAELIEELKVTYEGSLELCGEDDEINTIPAKEKYEQLLEILDYVKELQEYKSLETAS